MVDPNEPNLVQYQIVADLLARQDEVLDQLNELNARIETEIKEANESRNTEGELAESATEVADAPAKAA